LAFKDKVQAVLRCIKYNIYHFVFIMTLFLMILLVSWWAISIKKSNSYQLMQEYQELKYSIRYFKRSLGTNRDKPKIGTFQIDKKLEIAPFNGLETALVQYLHPYWSNLVIRARPEYTAEIENKYKLKSTEFMLESFALSLLLLISIFMFYYLIIQEKKTVRELSNLWRRMSHEVVTPIAGLKTFLETLETKPLKSKEIKPLLKLAQKQIERQELLSDNLLIGQLLHERDELLTRETIEINSFCKKYFQKSYRKLWNISTDFENLHPGEIYIKGSEEGLNVVFNNIIDNAIKYGSDDVKITVATNKTGKYGIISLADNGPGFKPETLRSLFLSLRRNIQKIGGKHSGAGIGLLISRKVINKMGGDLNIGNSKKTGGAEIKIKLKLAGK